MTTNSEFLELTKEQMQQMTREGYTYIMEPDGLVTKITINDLYVSNDSIDVMEDYAKNVLPNKKGISDIQRDKLKAFIEAFINLKKKV